MNRSSAPLERDPSSQRWFAFLFKATVTGLLFWWLASSNALEWKSLAVLVESPGILSATLGTWVVVSVLLSTWRWRLLLRASGISLPFRRTAALQMMALFFNSVVPGNVGGDVLKNLYVMPRQRAQIFVTVLGERIIGLFGLIWMGAIWAAVHFRQLRSDPKLAPIVLTLGTLVLGTVLAPLVGIRMSRFLARSRSGDELGKFRRSLGAALGLFDEQRPHLLRAWFVSLLLHLTNMTYFLLITRELGNPAADLGRVALVYPLGMLTLALPISLSGLGVGHVAFQQLFTLVGLSNGANVFNVFIVGALAPCLIGAIPYLFLRAEKPDAISHPPLTEP